MQCAVVEFAQNVLKLSGAASTEMVPDTPYPVIDLMEDQKDIQTKGGTMRLGSYECHLEKGTRTHSIYKNINIAERHRHRYEFNNEYKQQLADAGMVASGINPATGLVEVIEIPEHKWFVGVQFHPEYKSTVECPHPLFVSFVKVCMG